ncbi:hypothetical protein MEA186_06373 [Mesorhizobium amorphae CCNWGS0123]|uniref:Uncharacterized protein n=1 Tax=Mesorhizobium amorphae CCNWGS0123 TaxID=1082933 RepID=G6Y5R5_9HYPH|nr:hypothetical protein MEA186_06373 [Mesorhizobium amorphae CCNWGS0123]
MAGHMGKRRFEGVAFHLSLLSVDGIRCMTLPLAIGHRYGH